MGANWSGGNLSQLNINRAAPYGPPKENTQSFSHRALPAPSENSSKGGLPLTSATLSVGAHAPHWKPLHHEHRSGAQA